MHPRGSETPPTLTGFFPPTLTGSSPDPDGGTFGARAHTQFCRPAQPAPGLTFAGDAPSPVAKIPPTLTGFDHFSFSRDQTPPCGTARPFGRGAVHGALRQAA